MRGAAILKGRQYSDHVPSTAPEPRTAGLQLHRWTDRAVVGVAIAAFASGFGQFGVVAALGDVAKGFGQVTHGATFADQAGLSGTELGIGLAIAQPSGASDSAPDQSWIIALFVIALFEAVLIILATGTRGEARAALLGLAAACGYALTAALIKSAMADLGGGAVEFFSNWHIYAAAAAGVGSLFLLQNALQAGSLVASQPMLTVGDALISIALGVTLFNEELRGGWWLLPQIVALGLIIVGCVQIAKSPLAADPGGLVSESASTVQLAV